MDKPKEEVGKKSKKTSKTRQEVKTDKPLPNGWKAYVSNSKPDRVFYFNCKTGTTSWEVPSAEKKVRASSSKYLEKSKSDKLKLVQKEQLVKKKRSKDEVPTASKRKFEAESDTESKTEVKRKCSEPPAVSDNLKNDSLGDLTASQQFSQTSERQRSSPCTTDESCKKSSPKEQECSPSNMKMEVISTLPTVHRSDPPRGAEETQVDSKSVQAAPLDKVFLNIWLNSHVEDAQIESMDWETSEIPPPFEVAESGENHNSWYVVVDTNVLLENLNFVQRLRDGAIQNFEAIVVIPWVVLQELDHFKSENSKKPQLKYSARSAIAFIHKTLTMKHPKLKGQFCLNDGKSKLKNDDEILKHCLELQSQNKRVMLLTEDKNLCNKAVIATIECKSIDRLRQWLNPDPDSTEHMDQQSEGSKDDNCVPLQDIASSAKETLVSFLSHVLSSEMKKSYAEMWLQIVLHKPPWSFKELMACLDKHWIAVISDVFERGAQDLIKSLSKNKAFNCHQNWNKIEIKDMKYALSQSLSLCQSVRPSCYKTYRNETVDKIMALAEQIIKAANDAGPSIADISPKTDANSPGLSNPTVPETDESPIILRLFESLFNHSQSYCVGVEKVIAEPDPQNIQKIEPQILTYYRYLKSFIKVNEKLLEAHGNCAKDDLTEMQCLLLCNPSTADSTDQEDQVFSLQDLQDFYKEKREALYQAGEVFKGLIQLISKGMTILMSRKN